MTQIQRDFLREIRATREASKVDPDFVGYALRHSDDVDDKVRRVLMGMASTWGMVFRQNRNYLLLLKKEVNPRDN